jgi:hypothetical protein
MEKEEEGGNEGIEHLQVPYIVADAELCGCRGCDGEGTEEGDTQGTSAITGEKIGEHLGGPFQAGL